MSEAIDTTNVHNEEVRTYRPKTLRDFEKDPVSSYEVWQWPEFKALAERLGINWGSRTTDLSIHLPIDGNVTVDHTYQCIDHGA